jgi:uncharacterized protein YjiS (DUF1127 family)
MSAHTADSQLSFRLPSLSYIDAKWEEPDLNAPKAASASVRATGIAAWLAHQVAALVSWRRNSEAAHELVLMSDFELADIGLSRSDLSRVFQPEFSQDLNQRGIGL